MSKTLAKQSGGSPLFNQRNTTCGDHQALLLIMWQFYRIRPEAKEAIDFANAILLQSATSIVLEKLQNEH